jgi:hypothetical protein
MTDYNKSPESNPEFFDPLSNKISAGADNFIDICVGSVAAGGFVDGELKRDANGSYYRIDAFGMVWVGDKDDKIVETMPVSEFVKGIAYSLTVKGEIDAPSESLVDTTIYSIGYLKGELRDTNELDAIKVLKHRGPIRTMSRRNM